MLSSSGFLRRLYTRSEQSNPPATKNFSANYSAEWIVPIYPLVSVILSEEDSRSSVSWISSPRILLATYFSSLSCSLRLGLTSAFLSNRSCRLSDVKKLWMSSRKSGTGAEGRLSSSAKTCFRVALLLVISCVTRLNLSALTSSRNLVKFLRRSSRRSFSRT